MVKNIEDLFKCGKFCANLKHSERLNSGVMVVEPSETLFSDMMSKVKTTFSYTGGKISLLTVYIFFINCVFLLYIVLFTSLRKSFSLVSFIDKPIAVDNLLLL